MTLRIAIQMDDPADFNPKGDSTIVLGLEAQNRGHTLFYYLPGDLTYDEGALVATVRPIRFFDDTKKWFETDPPLRLNLREVDVVLMRQDPPYDMNYLTPTYLLDHIRDTVLVVNDPSTVRNAPEKLSILEFQEFIPPTLITRDVAAVHAFRAKHEEIVVKPLYGFGGHEIYVFRKGDANLPALLEHYFRQSGEPLMIQRFLPEVATEDRRVILIDGQIKGVMGRVPPSGEIRANLRAGGSAEKVELNPKQKYICETVGAVIRDYGILFAGVDLIGDYLTEINLTSPTGLRAIMALENHNPAMDFWDAVEAKISSERN